MQSAPSVSYPVGRSVFLGKVLAAIGCLGLLAVGLAVAFDVAWWGLVVALVAAWWCTAGWAWQGQPSGHLAWKSASSADQALDAVSAVSAWVWSGASPPEREALALVERIYDWQSAMLLRVVDAQGAKRWLWVERRTDPGRWDDLRRALWAHA